MAIDDKLTCFLQPTIAAAEAAGRVLTAEFARSGGPRGRAGHAHVDDEIEDKDQQALGKRFSDWSLKATTEEALDEGLRLLRLRLTQAGVAREFRDFDLSTPPQIPECFTCAAWHNDTCPDMA